MQQHRSGGFIRGLIAMGLLTAVVSLTDQAHAQTTANGPYYATPSWDQTLPSATRFIVLSNFNNEAVLDRNTGLVWEQSPSTLELNWFNARFHCLNKSVGNQKGWRLPAIVELLSLVDPTKGNPALPAGHPFSDDIARLSNYWSATTDVEDPRLAWIMIFFTGNVSSGLKSPDSRAVWCVRGGMNADQY